MTTTNATDACPPGVPRVSMAGALGLAVASGSGKGGNVAASEQASSGDRAVNAIDLVANRIDGSLRIFIAHTAAAFVAFRTGLREKSGDRRQLISRVSKLYRSALAQLNESQVNGYGEGDDGGGEASSNRGNNNMSLDVFRSVESVWHLCEILVIDPQPPGVLIQQLQQWSAAWSSPTGNGKSKAALDSGSSTKEFWDTFLTLIMLGQIEDGCALLRGHENGTRPDFALMINVLESMPVLGHNAAHLAFLNQLGEWQDMIRPLVDNERFGADTEFVSACRLLLGDAVELNQRRRLCDTWFQFVVTKAAYCQPLARASDLAKLADQVLASSNDFISSDPLSQLVLALFHGNLQAFTRQLADLDDLWWTGAHLVDLLVASGDLQTRNVHHVDALHEQLLRDYALCLLSQRPLWETALMYLEFCEPSNKPMLVQALVSVHCPTQYKALKVAAVADRLGLMDAALSIYRMRSMHWLKRGRLDSALTWAIRSRNSPLISRVAELILQDYLETGRLVCADQLQGLGQEMLVSERLAFLAKYADFTSLRESSTSAEVAARACELLLFLIDSQWAPGFFVPRLLQDAVALLEDDRLPPQNIAHLQRLMACLQGLDKDVSGELNSKFQMQLNFACAKRTAQSLLSLMQAPNETSPF